MVNLWQSEEVGIWWFSSKKSRTCMAGIEHVLAGILSVESRSVRIQKRVVRFVRSLRVWLARTQAPMLSRGMPVTPH